MTDYAPAIATREIDDDRLIATRWTFPPGSATGWHRHGFDYLVVPTIGGTLTIQDGEGKLHDYDIHTGKPYQRGLGTEHDVINRTDRVVEFVEIEFK